MRLFIIGYMGSGKTTVAKKIAKKMDLIFVDIDNFIEEKYKTSVFSIFKEQGEKEFRKIERDCLKEICYKDNLVIATGGGTPCFYDNMDYMNKKGITIYLEAQAEFLLSRIINSKIKRPLIINKSKKELLEYISKSLLEREKYYLQAKYVIKAKNVNIDEINL